MNAPEEKPVVLRPHHLLCIQKFTGHGYDERFTVFMNGLVRELKAAADRKICLVSGCDDLCKACPNNMDGLCVSAQKVEKMDQAVISVCGSDLKRLSDGLPVSGTDISAGRGVTTCNDRCLFTGTWHDFSEAAKEKILKTKVFGDICSECQWYEICKNTERGIIDG